MTNPKSWRDLTADPPAMLRAFAAGPGRGMYMTDLARGLGISRRAMEDWLSGSRKPASVPLLVRALSDYERELKDADRNPL